MKGMEMFCASQAATSIRRLSTEDSGSSTTTSTIYLGGNTSGRILDRHNPIIRDATRITKVLLNTSTPCISSNPPPITPKPKKFSRKENTNTNHQLKKKNAISSKQNDIDNNTNTTSSSTSNTKKRMSFSSSWSCTKPSEFISPPGSSRYLLSSSTTQKSSSFLSDRFDPLLEFVPAGPPQQHSTATNQDHGNAKKEDDDIVVVDDGNGDNDSSANSSNLANSSSASSASSADQVVVLKVSLHCRGCERKMKKHLSKMEGVTSFTIDFAAKKLTVVGDVTPLSVLASVSKVKNAQLLTPPLASSVPSACSNLSEIKKNKGILV